tara:strand:- start:188 stop:916 length:729 start_codon:yes stop_codon:yes gene_type:complete
MNKAAHILITISILLSAGCSSKFELNSLKLRHPKGGLLGFDVSQYQGVIQWDKLKSSETKRTLQFIMIRSTAGDNLRDRMFTSNWRESKKQKLVRGAYHYYRPDENSIKQASNYIKNVKLEKGDLPPILDIEAKSKVQSMSSLKVGIQRYLDKVEAHYGVKPIIYSSQNYYLTFLKTHFSKYPLWIANYNQAKYPIIKGWKFWQYTDHGKLKGINGDVDLNIFQGSIADLKKLCIQQKIKEP